MPRNLLKRLLPAPDRLRGNGALRLLYGWLHDPRLWHLNRRSATRATFIGIATAFIPLPIHMLVAATGAVLLRCNVALAVVLVWISNPLTMGPMYYGCYRVGSRLLGVDATMPDFHMTLEWLGHGMQLIWAPLLLGCTVCGLGFGTLAWASASLCWRIAAGRRWRRRQRLRAARGERPRYS